jgi:Chromate transport protein ChrA
VINPFIYFLLFLKATVFSSGGLSNLPSLHQDLRAEGWATEANFTDSVAIGQVTPGPNGLWVISLGYLTYGYVGALLALIAITIPPFFVLIVQRIFKRLEKQRWVDSLLRGISLVVASTSFTIFWITGSHAGTDWRSWFICAGAFLLSLTKRVNIVVILILAAIAGYFIYH